MTECQAKNCGKDADTGLVLMEEAEIAKHYGEFCKDHYQEVDKAIEEAAYKLRNPESTSFKNKGEGSA